ncbi:proton-conducting transporter transmembrane domain-containing protein [Saccharolobus islandicus]|uniref:NADH/Ubiquinone/plastoquinone (Complex I) n=1 Tax=Saccharolobus islandicus (strain M.16.27) TaxID=427318 RepID=C3N577_SACI3|nr:proton-conducting transporter membrane subunit [Sulfolobus islandicus]ACP55152.1 NADH/Ubiquinone/plastoquinone (complex I) [Sulfolobus islandicus M.16.27]
MNTLLYTLPPFLISIIFSIFNKKAGYILTMISSIILLITSIYEYNGVLSFFSIISTSVWILASIFSIEYDHYGKWLSPLYILTILGMAIVLNSDGYLLFLAGWEIMTIPAYVAIGLTAKNNRPPFVFMAFGELSTVLILAGFIIANTTNFNYLPSPVPLIVATFGFIIKMGMMPFLVSEWLPIAHGTAPSNFSAILSATMTLMGVYGILKITILTQTIPIGFSLTIMAIGAFSIFFGALYGYVNENTKGILAFSTIENNGAILVALSLYMISKQLNITSIEHISLITVILYSFAHSVAKTGLFLSSGLQEKQSITYSKKIRNIEIGLTLLASSMSGLLPNIGGVASWLLLENLFMFLYVLHNVISILFIMTGAIIAMGEGLATALLIRYITYTSIFQNTREQLSKIKKYPILLSALIVLILGFTLPYLIYPYKNSTTILGMLTNSVILTQYYNTTFGGISPLYIILLLVAFSIVSYLAFGKPKIRKAETWNNGVNEKEEYTAFAMANNIRQMLKKILRPEEEKFLPTYGLDVFWEYLYKLANSIRRFGKIFAKTLINSSISWYIIYIILTLIVVIIVVVMG